MKEKFFADYTAVPRGFLPGPLECIRCTEEEAAEFVRLLAYVKNELTRCTGFDGVIRLTLSTDLSELISRKKVIGAVKAALAYHWEIEEEETSCGSSKLKIRPNCHI